MTSHGWDQHGEWDALAVGWAMSTLDPQDEAIFLPHLATCERCSDLVAETTRTVGEIGMIVPEEEPPPQLKERLMAAVRNEPRRGPPAWGSAPPRLGAPEAPPGPPAFAPPPPSNVLPFERKPRRWQSLSAAAAAVVVIAGLGAWNVSMRSDVNSQKERVAAVQSVVDQMITPGTKTVPLSQNGKPVGAVLLRNDGIRLVTAGLPENAAERMYVLWAIPPGGGPDQAAAMQSFEVTSTDPTIQTVSTPPPGAADAGAYAVSVEKQAPSPPEHPNKQEIVALSGS